MTKASKAKPSTKKPAVVEKPAPDAKPATARVERFDRSPYDPLPVMDLGEAIALSSALLSAKPRGAPHAVDEEAARVAAARDHGQAVLQSHVAQAPAADLRPYDVAMDNAWATVVRRVKDHADVPVERHAGAARAAEVYELIKDVTILKLDYFNEHTQIAARLALLDQKGMLADVRALAGGVFLDNALFCLGEYGKAQGITEAKPATPAQPGDRGEARLALVDLLNEYVAQVVPLARAGRPDTWEFVRKALAPIVELRARQAKAARAKPAPVADPSPADPATVK